MTTVVDGHLHVHRPGDPTADHELFPEGWGATVEDLAAAHDEHGVDGAVMVPVGSAPAHTEYATEAAAAYPGMSAVIGVYDASVDDAVGHYRDLLQDHDLQGLRVMTLDGDPGDDPQDLDIWPLLEEFADRGHCLWMYPLPGEYELVDAVAEALPDLKVVYNLLGYPQPGTLEAYVADEHGRPTLPTMEMPPERLETLTRSGRRPNTYVMFGGHFQYSDEGYPYHDMVDHSEALRDSFGPDHMFFITDWPWTAAVPGYDRLLDLIDVHLPDLDEGERADVMGGTVQRLLDF
jgi:predicted TIM-barrel fold metal-dependent hydrolase